MIKIFDGRTSSRVLLNGGKSVNIYFSYQERSSLIKKVKPEKFSSFLFSQ